MPSPEQIRFILLQAIAAKPDDGKVSLPADLLAQGFGIEKATELLGINIDPEQIARANADVVRTRTGALKDERTRLRELHIAGFNQDAKLKKVNKLLTAATTGRLKALRIVTVNVGVLRLALSEIPPSEIPPQASETAPA